MADPAYNPFPPNLRFSLDALRLRRGGRELFQALSLAAGPSDFVAIRGPNGVGKTSLLRLLAGFLRPVSGAISLDGVEDRQLAVHYLGHQDALKTAIHPRAHLEYWALTLGEGAGRVDEVLELIGLSAIADLPAAYLSQGQRRRLALGRLAVAPRPLWLLDEPAAALDANGKSILDTLIESHRAAGGIVMAALHEDLGARPSKTLELSRA